MSATTPTPQCYYVVYEKYHDIAFGEWWPAYAEYPTYEDAVAWIKAAKRRDDVQSVIGPLILAEPPKDTPPT